MLMLMEVTYRCNEYENDTGRWVEGENVCHLRVQEDQAAVQPNGRVILSPHTQCWVEDAIAAVERLQGREYLRGSICDIRLAKKED